MRCSVPALLLTLLGLGACAAPEPEIRHTEEAALSLAIQGPVEEAIQLLDAMRSGLASRIDMDPVDAGHRL